ncbi:MAG: hypothetical protein E6G06_22490 [Actinobacteria bacterium]|nr:MAG: hypothetical protein E6G06_22490 [Actinomycetota bacterium]
MARCAASPPPSGQPTSNPMTSSKRRCSWRFDADRSAPMRTRQTILNLSRNHRRSLARRGKSLPRLVASVAAPPPSYPSDLAELLRLPAEVRAVLYLADVEGYSFPEIAATLRCSPAVARARASRGRRRLRSELGMEV